MKKIIRLTEEDLTRLVKRVLEEQSNPLSDALSSAGEYLSGPIKNVAKSLGLSSEEPPMISHPKLAKYSTEGNHVLSKGGSTVKINQGDIWKQVGFEASPFDYMIHEKSGIAFLCNPSDISKSRVSDSKNLYNFSNSQLLIKSLQSKFCKGRSFNYDKYPSVECISALKSGREGFEGCDRL
jgi:hypothetical protein